MGSDDRNSTGRTVRAMLSWRLLLGIGVGAAITVAGLPIAVGVGVGVALYAATVAAAIADGPSRPAIDPFTLGEPWRQLVQRAQEAERRLRDTVGGVPDGPMRSTLDDLTASVARGVDEAWQIAQRGDEIDDAVRRLDPTGIRTRLAAAEQRLLDEGSADATTTVESLRRQLESAERLQRSSDETATALRRSQAQLDELVARASELQLDRATDIEADTAAYVREVDDLVVRLEALHRAIEEVA